MKHPMQPLYRDAHGTIRFIPNLIIRWAVDTGRIDLNEIARMNRFSAEDQTQFAMLIGYSVSGAGDLSYFDRETIERADEAAAALIEGQATP